MMLYIVVAEWLLGNTLLWRLLLNFKLRKPGGEKKKTMTLKWFSGRLGREKSDCQSHSGGHAKYIWMDKNRVESSGVELSWVEPSRVDQNWSNTVFPNMHISSDHTSLIVLMVEVPSSKWNPGKLPSSKRDNKIRPIGNFIQRKKLFRPRKECRSRKKKVC